MKAVEPPGDARPEWEFLRELLLELSGQAGFVSIEGLFNQMARRGSRVQRLDLGGPGRHGSNRSI